MAICYEDDLVTFKKLRNLLGTSMRIIPHVEGSIVVDIQHDTFYVIENTGRRNRDNEGIYKVVLIGLLDRLIKLLLERKINVE